MSTQMCINVNILHTFSTTDIYSSLVQTKSGAALFPAQE